MADEKKTVAENCDDLKPIRIDQTKAQMKPWNGMMVPCIDEEPDVHFDKILNMQIRDNDIMLVSFPKSGTHWMWRILDLLVNKTTDYGDRCIDFGFLDMQRIERVDNLESPRVLSAHIRLDYLPKQIKEKRTKLVHVYRNPKAVLVSMYFMMKNFGIMKDVTLEKLDMSFHANQAPDMLMKWTCFWDEVTEFEKNNPDVPIFHISYEELKLNTVESIKKLAEFLDVDASQELCEAIADAVSFKNQKDQEVKSAPDSTAKAKFYRKGEIDDWKNYLTVAQSERLDQAIKERADRCRFSAKYVN